MVKQTQTVHRLLPTNCLSAFDHFMGLGFKGIKCNDSVSYDVAFTSFRSFPVI